MSTNIVFNGTTYAIPAEGDSGWGTVLSNYFIALASGTLSKSGGSFALLADVDFGATYGAKIAYIKSQATNPSGTGIVRLGNNEAIGWRNAANTSDLSLKVNASDILQFNGVNVVLAGAGLIVNADVSASAAIDYSKLNLAGALVNADISVSAAIAYSKLALTGSIVNADIGASAAIAYSKLSLTGAIVNADIQASAAIAYSKLALTGSIVDSDISGSAAIALSKLAALATGKALQSNASTGAIEASSVTNTELGYLSGVSSAIQTQLNAKEGTLTAGTSGQYYRGDKTWQTLDRSAVGLSNVDNTSDATKNAATVTLTNKDFDGGIASNTSRITLPKAAKTTLDALTRKEGTILFDTTSGKPYYDDGTVLKVIGSGSGGGTNFITNGDAETGITGWATYADAASTRPVDGTGGTANVTLTTSSTSPLVGTNSFIFTKDAADRQGQGASYDFTIDAAYKAKVLKIEADYIVNSGTFAAGSSTTDSDVIVYIYDVTNSTLIEPSSFKFLSNSTTISDKFSATFQTSATGTQYRLIFHVASTSTAAYALKIDNVSVSPSQYVYGTPITDWVSYTPTLTNLGNATINYAKWRGVGTDIEIESDIQMGSSLPTGTIEISSPVEGQNPVIAGNFAVPNSNSVAGVASSGATYSGVVRFDATTKRFSFLGGNNQQLWNATVPFTWAQNDRLRLSASYSVQGWSSSVQVSDGYEGRVVAASAYGTPTGTISTSDNVIVWGAASVKLDKTAAYNSSTGLFTVQASGEYEVIATPRFGFTAAGSKYVNATIIFAGSISESVITTARPPSDAVDIMPTVSAIRTLRAGDTIGIYSNTNATSPTHGIGQMSIKKLSGSATISATETVSALYTGAPPTGTLGAAWNTVTFGTKVKDSHGAYSSGTYTIQVSGQYDISSQVAIQMDIVAGAIAGCGLSINNSASPIYQNQIRGQATTASGILMPQINLKSIQLKAGDTIKVVSYAGGASPTYLSDATINFFSITRSGGY